MKQIYVCEKCGQVYEDSMEAYNCEYSHCEVDVVVRNYDDVVGQTWKKGDVLPSVIYAGADIYKDGKRTAVYGEYKFVKMSKVHADRRNKELEAYEAKEARDDARREVIKEEIKTALVDRGYSDSLDRKSFWALLTIYRDYVGEDFQYSMEDGE